MLIKALVENTSTSGDFESQHGLSIYIETEDNKILFDTGANGLFLKNAKKLNVDIKDIDLAAISHGHYDHGGGLKAFLEENKKAKVYINKDAFNNYFSQKPDGGYNYIGFDQDLKGHERFIYVDKYLSIDKNIELFSGVEGREFFSQANKNLLMDNNGILEEDLFKHEQNMIIGQKDKTVLLAGCAHNGIVNIIKKFKKIKGFEPDFLIGGFHLYNRHINKSEDISVIKGIAKYLTGTSSIYYTGHCTGTEAYNNLKEIMGDQIHYLSTGTVIEV